MKDPIEVGFKVSEMDLWKSAPNEIPWKEYLNAASEYLKLLFPSQCPEVDARNVPERGGEVE